MILTIDPDQIVLICYSSGWKSKSQG